MLKDEESRFPESSSSCSTRARDWSTDICCLSDSIVSSSSWEYKQRVNCQNMGLQGSKKVPFGSGTSGFSCWVRNFQSSLAHISIARSLRGPVSDRSRPSGKGKGGGRGGRRSSRPWDKGGPGLKIFFRPFGPQFGQPLHVACKGISRSENGEWK